MLGTFTRFCRPSQTIRKIQSMTPKTLSVVNSQKLDKLARTIRDTYSAAERLAAAARDKGREAIAEALLCGNALNEAKKLVPHGRWLGWLEGHCKGVSERTAQNYMRLANTKHVADLLCSRNVTQAYVKIGILPSPTPPPALAQLSDGTHTEALPITPVINVEVLSQANPEARLKELAAPLISTLHDYVVSGIISTEAARLFIARLGEGLGV